MRLRGLVVFLLAGCADPKLPDQVIEGRHVRYHYWADMGAPCPEAIEQMDRFIELLAAKVKRPPPLGYRVDYYRVRDAEAVREYCVPKAASCAFENKVYSTEWTFDHELAHAFLNHFANPPLLFLEGAAMMFECGPARWSGVPIAKVDLEPLIDDDAWGNALSETNHLAAGAFSRWLVDRHGLEAFIRFYETAEYKSSRAQVNAKFRAAFGVELSDALAEWHAGPVARDGEFCLPVEDLCDAEPEFRLDTAATKQSVTSEVTCVKRVSVFEVDDVPVTRVRFTASEPDRILKVRPCDPSGSAGQQLNHTFFGAGTTNLRDGKWIDSWSTLRPGRYSLSLENTKLSYPRSVSSPPGGTASIEVEAHGPVISDSCSAQPIPVPDDSWTMHFSLGGDGGVLQLVPASERRIVGVYGRFAEGSLCSGCVSPTACVSVKPGDGYPGFLRGPTILRLQPQDDAGLFVELVLEPPS